MWQGLFLRRCMNINYGYMVSLSGDEGMCTYDSDCIQYNEPGMQFVCAKGFVNPNNGVTNFDNLYNAFVTVFVIVSQEGWTNVFAFVTKTPE